MWSSPSAAPIGCWSWRGSTRTDARVLIAGYDYGGKDREDVTGELVERAIGLGYLSGGETVSITVTSADADWQAREEQAAREALEERYGEAIVIRIGPAPEEEPANRGGDPGGAAQPHAGPHLGPHAGACAGAHAGALRAPCPLCRPGDHGLR